MAIINLFNNAFMPDVLPGVITSAGKRRWFASASSADGSFIAAIVNGGYIYTTDDYGKTWIEQTGAGIRNWNNIAMSDDGAKLVATAGWGGNPTGFTFGQDYIYRSSDYGKTWTPCTGAGMLQWVGITSSADGVNLAATVMFDPNKDYLQPLSQCQIYTSADSGVTWVARTGAGARDWRYHMMAISIHPLIMVSLGQLELELAVRIGSES